MKKRQCAARLLLRVPIGGARPACSTGQTPRHAPCLHERRHKKKDRAAPSAQGVFASAERGRTPRVLHRRDPRPIPRRIKRREAWAKKRQCAARLLFSAQHGCFCECRTGAHAPRAPPALCRARTRAGIKRPDGAISRTLKETRECCRNDIENQEQTTCLRWQSRTGDRSCAYAVKLRKVSWC